MSDKILERARKATRGKTVFVAEDGVIINADCRDILDEFRQEIPLILTDPPYGLDIASTGSLSIKGASDARREWEPTDWDINPADPLYFPKMLTAARNQIIWGGNYFSHLLPPSACWLIWFKKAGLPARTFADCELAWTSFDRPARVFNSRWHGFIRDSKELRVDFPTQKPLDLFAWCIREFSNEGDIIFDPFLGSGTTCIAARMLRRKFIGIEINPAYAAMAVKRMEKVQQAFWLI